MTQKTKTLSSLLGLIFLMFAPSGVISGESKCCSEKEMAYANGEVSLAGVLLTPKSGGPFPAVVLLQGSGTSDRSNGWARLIAETFVEDGVAVLLTDKRGSGKSGGDWRVSDFEDLAWDALAGVKALRGLKEISPDMIGFIGLSEGGHVAPLAASLGDVQFVINFVGAALPMKGTLIHELEQTYRQFGADEPTIEFLQGMTYASFRYIETSEGWEDYLAVRGAIEANIGAMAVETWPDTEDNWYWAFWRDIHDFDPIPYWKTVTEKKGIPSFVAYGELDEFDNIPVAASVARFQENITSENLTVKVYAGTGHSLMDEEKRKNMEFQLVQPLLDDLETWIRRNIQKE